MQSSVRLAVLRATLRRQSQCYNYTPAIKRHATTTGTNSDPPSSPLSSPRRSVTITNDTGRVPWSDLSVREKAARGTQQSFNLAVVLVGMTLTAGVAVALWLDVLSPDSKTAVFNQVVDKVRAHPRANAVLLGPTGKGKIEAHGENSQMKLDRNRAIASHVETDRTGIEHMKMHFHVSGPTNAGVVQVHMLKDVNEGKRWATQSISLDVPGHQRIWIEVKAVAPKGSTLAKDGTLFGIKLW